MKIAILSFIAAAVLTGCGGGVNILPEPFTRERVDGKIPVRADLIRQQVQKELDGVPEGEAEVARWQIIETDYNQCRLRASGHKRAKQEEVFAACMSERGYVYMFPIDAEQFHNDIAFEEEKTYSDRKKAEEEARLAAINQVRSENKLWMSARDGNLSEVRRLLAGGVNPDSANEIGGTALIMAAIIGHKEIAEMLLAVGANPNMVDKKDYTALMFAAIAGHVEVVKVLLTAKMNLNASNNDGETALIMAVKNEHPEIVKFLLSAGAETILVDNEGATALIAAAQRGQTKIVNMLLSAGTNLNWGDNKGMTALMWATNEGYAEIVNILLSADADPNVVNNDGGTALILAAFRGYTEITEMLLSAGANLNKESKSGFTALMFSAREGHSEVAEMLLSAGANPNAVNERGGTALMTAAAFGNAEVVKILLAGGAEVNQRMPEGVTALDFAKFKGFSKIVSILQSPERWRSPATTASPQTTNAAENVFANVWRNIVVVRSGDNQGSGVIVRPNVVATNCHVFAGSDIVVYKHNNRRASTDTTFNASVRHRDSVRDFCLLNVPGLQGDTATIRRYDSLAVGENVYAVGSPQGLDLSLSSGLISQLRQGTSNRYIQTDAAISPGSSGGGLFDENGNLIGIITEKIADENVEGIGFAIPADLTADY